MEGGGRGLLIGAERGLGMQRISLCARAMALVVAGGRLVLYPERNERRLGTMGAGPAGQQDREGDKERASVQWPSGAGAA